ISFYLFFFFFSSRRRHTRFSRDWSSDVCSSDLFRDFGVSITGVSYARLPHGPAPDKFGLLLSHAAVAGVIELEEAEFGEYIGDMIRPLTPLDETLFDEHETATFEYILRRFGRHSAKRLKIGRAHV